MLCIAEWRTSTALKSKRRQQYWNPSAENDDFRFTSYQATKFQAWKYGLECLTFGEVATVLCYFCDVSQSFLLLLVKTGAVRTSLMHVH